MADASNGGEGSAPSANGWGGDPATIGQMVSLYVFQFVMVLALLAALFFAWPYTRATERDRAQVIADSLVKHELVRLDSAAVANGHAPILQAQARDSLRAPSDSAARPTGDGLLSAAYAFFVIVLCAGALGTLFRGIGSFAWYAGTRTLKKSWLLNYYLQPVKGAVLGLIFFFVFRAGLVATNTPIGESNPAGFAALAALVGMFEREATKKLQAVAEALFANTQETVDRTPPDAVASNEPAKGPGDDSLPLSPAPQGDGTGAGVSAPEADPLKKGDLSKV